MKETNLKMIEELTNAYGPSGFEDDVVPVLRKYTEGLGTQEEDCLRNFYLFRKENTGNKPVMMLDAHTDEVGFMVHSIRPNGTLRLMTLGNTSISALVSNSVMIRNKEGKYIPGIVASKPHHFMTAIEKANSSSLAISDLSVDIGATSLEEAKNVFGIRIGEPVVFNTRFTYDAEHDVMMGKAFDDRIGDACVIEVLRRLQNKELNVDVVGDFSVQEEVSERGAQVACNRVKPDICICFEGCPADDTFTPDYAIQTALKKGPMLRFMDMSVICSPRFQRFCLDLAEKYNMPVQSSVREGGGNNGAVINCYGKGVPTVVFGVPVRYIHSANCITSYYDFEATVELAVKVIEELNAEIIAQF